MDPVVVPYNLTLPASFDLSLLGIKGLTGSASGSAGISGAGTFNLTVTMGWFTPTLNYLSAKVETTMATALQIKAAYSDGGAFKAKLGEVQTVVVPFVIAGLPFVIRVPVQIFAKVEGETTLDASISKLISLEFIYDKSTTGWQTPILDLNQPVNWSLGATVKGNTGLGIDVVPSVSVAEVVGISSTLEFTAISAKGTAEFTAGNAKTTGICSGTNPLRVYSGIGISGDASILGFSNTLFGPLRGDMVWLNCWLEIDCGRKNFRKGKSCEESM